MSNKNRTVQRRWAYAFLLADCDPSQPYYRGILYNTLVSTYILKYQESSSSSADIVLLISMAANYHQDRLPRVEEELLERMQIQYRYILPKPTKPMTFYELVLLKFQVLDLVEYSRVLVLDGDVLPLCNLDYLLQLSEEGVLEETVLHAMYEDPVNAGLWVVKPGSYPQLQDVLKQRQEQSYQWNPQMGWKGSEASTNGSDAIDYRLWDGETGSGWDFYCADSDQGLLLYWSRFLQKHVSIIVGDTIERYSGSSVLFRVSRSSDIFANRSCLPPPMNNRRKTFAQNINTKVSSMIFYQDFYHMVGYSKAWESQLKRQIPLRKEDVQSSTEYWYFVLQKVVQRFDLDRIIPTPLSKLPASIGEPRVRGDLFAVGVGKDKHL